MSAKRRAAMRKLFKRKARASRSMKPPLPVLPIPDVVRDAASAAVFLGVNKTQARARATEFYRQGMTEGELLRLIISPP
jgi:hypothetical protein